MRNEENEATVFNFDAFYRYDVVSTNKATQSEQNKPNILNYFSGIKKNKLTQGLS